MREEAKLLLAWEDIEEEKSDLNLEDEDVGQIKRNAETARRNLREAVWRAYRKVLLLDKKGQIRTIDLGPGLSTDSGSLPGRIIEQLEKDGEVSKSPAATLLARNWPPAKNEWSTKDVRDAFYASPLFPRPRTQDCLKEMIARGVEMGAIGYVVRGPDGAEVQRLFQTRMEARDVEFSDEAFVITAEESERRKEPRRLERLTVFPESHALKPGDEFRFSASGFDQHEQPFQLNNPVIWEADGGPIDIDGNFTAGKKEGAFTIKAKIGNATATARAHIAKEPKKIEPEKKKESETYRVVRWEGEVPARKWNNFYLKVLSPFGGSDGLRVTAKIEIAPPGGVTRQKTEEIRTALDDLGLNTDVEGEE